MFGESLPAIVGMALVVLGVGILAYTYGYRVGRADEAEERRRRRSRSLHAMRRFKQQVQRTSQANVLAEMERAAAVRWRETQQRPGEAE